MLLKLDNFTPTHHKSEPFFTRAIRGNDVFIFTLRKTTTGAHHRHVSNLTSHTLPLPCACPPYVARTRWRQITSAASPASSEPASARASLSQLGSCFCPRNVHVDLCRDWGEKAKMTARVSLSRARSHGEIHAGHDGRVFKGYEVGFFSKEWGTSLCGGLRCHLKVGRLSARKWSGVSYDQLYYC